MIEARTAILDVVTAYFVAIDHRDFDALHRCFTDDVVADFDGKAVGPGRDAVIDFCAGRGPVDYPVDIVDIRLSHHQISNHLVHVEGDRAWAETYATAHLVDNPPSGLRMRTRGLRYLDAFVCTADGWRISERRHVCDWMRLDSLEWSAASIAPLPEPLRSALHGRSVAEGRGPG